MPDDPTVYNLTQVHAAALLLQALDLVMKYELASDQTLDGRGKRAGQIMEWALQAVHQKP